MTVRCIRLLGPMGNAQAESSWLTIGTIYHVLEVIQGVDRRWLVRLVGDGPNGLALFQLEQFDVVTHDMPDTWTIGWLDDGSFKLSPTAWRSPGFWERYYDREPNAIRSFEDEKRKIMALEP
jgi:hypothetical protein